MEKRRIAILGSTGSIGRQAGTLPESIIATWGGEKDQTAADEYATESHTWDVTQLFGTKSGGTEGHYYRFAKEGMRGAGTAQDVVELVGARGTNNVGIKTFDGTENPSWSDTSLCIYGIGATGSGKILSNRLAMQIGGTAQNGQNDMTAGKSNISYTGTYIRNKACTSVAAFKSWLQDLYNAGTPLEIIFKLATPLTFTSLFLSASSTSDELTQMPADAIPLSEIQFADNNWSIEEAIYDAPEADANGVITPTAVTGQMRIQYSLDAAEQILTLQTEYAALEARVTALENA